MKTKTPPLTIILTCAYAAAAIFVVFHLVRAGDYYMTGYQERPFHPDYTTYRPAGRLGLWFGIVGATMMTLLLLYSVRKRTRLFGNLFRVKQWLDVHILFGVVGPVLVLLHTSFKLNGLVAVSFWSMMAVAASGVFGRYLYLQIPRSLNGRELDREQLAEKKTQMTRQLQERFQLDDQQMEALHLLLSPSVSGVEPGLRQMITADIQRILGQGANYKTFMNYFQIPERDARKLATAAADWSLLETRIARMHKVQKLFHYWHVIHRPFALIMYIIMFIHIIVALLFGISWRKV